MKVFVAIPAYDRKVYCETVRSLLNEQGAASLLGIEMAVSFVPGCCYAHTARDHIARDFLATDCDRVVMIDSDVAWEPGQLLKLLSHKKRFVGGAYRYKDENEGYPVGWIPERPELIAVNGLIEVAALSGGFLSLDREVFSLLKTAHPHRGYDFCGQAFHGFFHCPPGGGEDGTFCAEWRAIGGRVWLDPELTLTHIDGGRRYTGCIGAWLKARPEGKHVENAG